MDNKKSFSEFIFKDRRSALLWLLVRVYVGLEWLKAGLGKIFEPAWVGGSAGGAVEGFVTKALTKTGGAHPDVSTWYAYFLKEIVLPNSSLFSHLVAFGEVLVGIALILGAFVGLAAFFGVVMNTSYLMAGTVSINPTLLLLGIFLILARRISGHYGLDRILQKRLPSISS